jgi:hypothetical protein
MSEKGTKTVDYLKVNEQVPCYVRAAASLQYLCDRLAEQNRTVIQFCRPQGGRGGGLGGGRGADGEGGTGRQQATYAVLPVHMKFFNALKREMYIRYRV